MENFNKLLMNKGGLLLPFKNDFSLSSS